MYKIICGIFRDWEQLKRQCESKSGRESRGSRNHGRLSWRGTAAIYPTEWLKGPALLGGRMILKRICKDTGSVQFLHFATAVINVAVAVYMTALIGRARSTNG
jgi:hypothetical protein